ncbi:hypothetical protein RIVM261_091160 [Rivularia sp. IAM M-261]|nr:hypothetical protein RIVM261_091160 [Rivularia sp. IAM M-261]
MIDILWDGHPCPSHKIIQKALRENTVTTEKHRMISYKEKRKQFSDEAQKRIQNRAQEIKDELIFLKKSK